MAALMSNKEVELKKAQHCLSDAEQLFSIGSYDAAANRAYYAVFHSMRYGLALVNEESLSDIKSHKGVIVHFSHHLVKTGLVSPEKGQQIAELQNLRQLADYSGDFLDKEDAYNSIAIAKGILADVINLNADRTPPEPEMVM